MSSVTFQEGDIITVGEKDQFLKQTSEEGVKTNVFGYLQYKWNGESFDQLKWSDGKPKIVENKSSNHYADKGAADAASLDPSESAKGAANITKDMFVKPDGSLKKIGDIYSTLDPLLPGITGDALRNQINDMLPQFEGVSAEKKGFLAEQYGGTVQDDPSTPEDESKDVSFAGSIAGQEAGAARQQDLYGLQQQAGQAGAQMRGAFAGGMGAGMRGAVGAQKALAQGFETATDAYGLSQQKADLASRKGVYGLEQAAEADYESSISQFLNPDWFKEAREGGYVRKDGSGIGENFSTFLAKLPEAGGS